MEDKTTYDLAIEILADCAAKAIEQESTQYTDEEILEASTFLHNRGRGCEGNKTLPKTKFYYRTENRFLAWLMYMFCGQWIFSESCAVYTISKIGSFNLIRWLNGWRYFNFGNGVEKVSIFTAIKFRWERLKKYGW